MRNELQEHMGWVKQLVLLSFGSDVNVTLPCVREMRSKVLWFQVTGDVSLL